MTYGSFVNGTGTKTSDIDISLFTSSYVDERSILTFINAILENNLNQDEFKLKPILGDVKVPLIQIQHREKKIEAELIINNILGYANSRLIYTYVNIDDKVKKLGVLIKVWSKKWEVSSQKRMTSYSLILMMIHYLQHKKFLPYLQSLNREKNASSSKIDIKRSK